jgi:penicillin-binding protein 1B
VSLRSALAHSYNLATIDLALKVGLEKIVDTSESFNFSTPLKPYPSIALGAFEMIPLEVARAYCVFAADGIQPYPLSLKSVLDEKGQVLERRHMSIKRVISPAKAFIMTALLQRVVEEGTARHLKTLVKTLGENAPVAGKTGTTNNSRDAWFVGYTPDILALVWVGFDNGDSIGLTGSTAAMPIWSDLINHIPQHLSRADFRMPPGVIRCPVCRQSGCPANENRCQEIVEEYFLKQNVPTRPCPPHREAVPARPATPSRRSRSGIHQEPVPSVSPVTPEKHLTPRERYNRRFNDFDR